MNKCYRRFLIVLSEPPIEKQRWKPDLAREENNPGKANLFLKSGKAQVASSERQIHRQADGTVLKGGFDKMERKKRFSIKKFQIEVKGSQGCEGSKGNEERLDSIFSSSTCCILEKKSKG